MDVQWETRFAEVLQLVVQHCPDANTPATLCALLGVSSNVNAALQQCRGQCHAKAYLQPSGRRPRYGSHIHHLGAFTGFARWLPKHAGLVSCITAHLDYVSLYDKPEAEDFRMSAHACEQLLSAALQLATVAAASPAPAAAAGQAQRLPLQLEVFESYFTVDTELLTALQASQVQVATAVLDKRTTVPSICRAFGQLTSLQELSICTTTGASVPVGLVEALQQLPSLKILKVECMQPEDAGRLSQNLTGLWVKWGRCEDNTRVDLGHLKALEWLEWRTEQPFQSMRAVLPSQLTSLDVYSPLSVAAMPKLQAALLEVTCHETLKILEDLRLLDELEALIVTVPRSAQHLPQDALTAAVSAISQLTSLTSLEFCTADTHEEHDNIVSLVDIPLGSALRGLKKLEYLQLQVGPTDRDDLLSLTELTALTALDLFAPCLDDFLAVAVLSNVTQLQELTLGSEVVRTGALMPLISKLTDLQQLELRLYHHAVHLGRAEVMQLGSLKQLSRLVLRPRIRASLVDALLAELPKLAASRLEYLFAAQLPQVENGSE